MPSGPSFDSGTGQGDTGGSSGGGGSDDDSTTGPDGSTGQDPTRGSDLPGDGGGGFNGGSGGTSGGGGVEPDVSMPSAPGGQSPTRGSDLPTGGGGGRSRPSRPATQRTGPALDPGRDMDVAASTLETGTPDRPSRPASGSTGPALDPGQTTPTRRRAERVTQQSYEEWVQGLTFQEEVRQGVSPGESLFGTTERDQALIEAADRGNLGAQLFTGGRGIGVLGQRGSRWLDERVPAFDVGPRIGGGEDTPTAGSQIRNVLVDIPAGAGLAGAVAPRRLGSSLAKLEDEFGGTDVPEEGFLSLGEAAGGTVGAGEKIARGAYEEPVGAVAGLLGPTAVSRLGRGAPSVVRGAGRRAQSRIEAGSPGPGNRGQLDLTPPDSRPSSGRSNGGTPDVDTDVQSPDFDLRPGPGQRRPGRLTDGPTEIRGGGPRSATAGAVSRGFTDQAQRAGVRADAPARTGQGATLSREIGGMLERLDAASAPSWVGSSSLIGADEQLGFEPPTPTTDTTQTVVTDQRADTDSLIDQAQTPQVTEDATTPPGTEEDTSVQSGQGTRTGGGTSTRTRQQPRTTLSPFPGFQTPDLSRDTPTFRTPRSPRPRSRRPRRRGGESTPFELSIPDFSLGGVSTTPTTADDTLSPGWFAETVTDIGTLGMELPGEPSQSQLSGLSTSIASATDLPTTQLLNGDSDVEAAAGLFDVGSEESNGSDGELSVGLDGVSIR